MAESIARAEVMVVPNAGHAVHLEAPEVVEGIARGRRPG
jgi:pimeloyl-ACP methyl ester carboxylesterase